MEDKIKKVVGDFPKYGCSGAILMNYQEETGWDNEKSLEVAREYLGGRKIKCGAVLAAEEVLKQKGIDKSDLLEEKFREKNGSVICRELKGLDGGKLLRSCPGCVLDSCTFLEELLK